MDNNMNGTDKQNTPNPMRGLIIWGFVIVGVLLVFTVGSGAWMGNSKALPISEVYQLVEADGIKSIKVELGTGKIEGELRVAGKSTKKNKKFFTSSIQPGDYDRNLAPLLREKKIKVFNPPESALRQILPTFLLMGFVAVMIYFLIFRQMRGGGGGGILSFGKSRAVRISKDKHKKTFADVAGVDEAREEVEEIIYFLRDPEKFQRLGGRLPKGVLLVGPPGTGKTLLAKAIAGEADVPFFSISGSDFVEMFVGVGASRVRDLFEQAKTNSPCIIFLDEIDAVGRRRANDLPGSGVETAQTLNAILVEMDGFTSDDNVIVIAATNRADVLDPALLRPGRFDRRIHVELPDVKGRKAILDVHTRKIKMGKNVDLEVLAKITPVFSGADIENMMNEAALLAAMRDRDDVDMACCEEARDKVRFGREKRSRVMDDEDRHATAVHEAGHALLMKFLPHVTPLHKVTIIPRGQALGATMQLPEKDEYSMARKKILGEVAVLLGGRAAEELFLDDVSSGAASDIDRATNLVRMMICEWGMSDALGMIRYSDRGGMYEGGMFEGREFSEATAEKIDNEVRMIMDAQYIVAKEALQEREAEVTLLVEGLMEFEVLDRDEITLMLGDGKLDGLRELRAAQEAEDAPDTPEEVEDVVEETKPAHPPINPDMGTPPSLAGGA